MLGTPGAAGSLNVTWPEAAVTRQAKTAPASMVSIRPTESTRRRGLAKG